MISIRLFVRTPEAGTSAASQNGNKKILSPWSGAYKFIKTTVFHCVCACRISTNKITVTTFCSLIRIQTEQKTYFWVPRTTNSLLLLFRIGCNAFRMPQIPKGERLWAACVYVLWCSKLDLNSENNFPKQRRRRRQHHTNDHVMNADDDDDDVTDCAATLNATPGRLNIWVRIAYIFYCVFFPLSVCCLCLALMQ